MVSKRVSSSSWTGPIDETVRRGAFTHRAGEFGTTTDYAWISRNKPVSFAVPEELRGVVRLAAWLLLSPLVLVAGWFGGELGVRGEVVSDPSGLLLLWGILVFVVAIWQLVSRSLHLVLARTFLLVLLMIGTVGIGVGYTAIAQRASAEAVVSEPQRVFRYVVGSTKTPFGRRPIFRHQRADGVDLEGWSRSPPLAHGHCLTAQPIQGRFGFFWIRVTEQMPYLKAGQLSWPISREDCFSSKPLSKLAQ